MTVPTMTMIGVAAAIAVLSVGALAQTGGVDLSKAKLRKPAQLTETAPATFKANFVTSKGPFVIEVHRDWAPKGADRFYNLVKSGYFDDCRFFRVISGFMVQFGLSGDPAVNAAWSSASIADDPVKQSNKRGFVTYAMGGPNTRSTQVFINYANNANLDSQGFSPFGQVVTGMEVVDKLYSGYGEAAQTQFMRIIREGNAFLTKDFPKLDSITKATVEK